MKQSRKIALASALATGLCAASSLAAGPGFGNLTYTDAEVFKHVSLFDNSNGTPTDSPSKAYGHNVALYLDGYLVFTFAPDSGNPTGGWLVYDVSNPRQPQLEHAHRGQDTQQLREPHSLPLAIVGDKTYVGVQTSVGIQIWDMTNPLMPSIAGRLSLPGVNSGDYTDVSWQLSWQFPYLYVAGGNRGVYIVDTSDVTQPSLVKQVQTSALGGFRVGPIFAMGDRLYLGNMDENARYSLLDLSDPTDPQLLDTLGTQTRYYAMSVLGNLIVGAGRDGDLLVHENRDDSIELVKQTRIAGDGLYLSFQDNFIHYGQTGSYKKLSFSDPNNVTILGEAHLPGHDADHGQVTPFGNLVFLGNDHGSGSGLVVHQKAADSTPPAIDWSFPANSAVNVPNDTAIGITFSDNVDPATLRTANVHLATAGGAAVAGTVTYLFNTLHFRSNMPLAEDTTYRFTVSTGVKDVMGNALAAEHQITFATGSTVMGGSGGSSGQGGSAGQPSTGGAAGMAGLGGVGGGLGGQGTGGSATAGTGGAPSAGNGAGGSVPTAGTGQGGAASVGGSASGGAGRGGTGGGSSSAGMSAGGSVSTGGSGARGGMPGQDTPEPDDSGCSIRAVGSTGGYTRAGWLVFAMTAAYVGLRRRRR
jgi:hypothetical protein